MVSLRTKVIKAIVCVAVSAASALFIYTNGGKVVSFMGKAALLSAASFMPSSHLIEEVEVMADNPSEEQPKTKTTELETKAVNIGTTEKEKQKNEPINTDDSDIKELIKAAEKAGKKERKDGSIAEYTFTDDGVTDSFGAVKVKNTNKTQPDIEKKLNEKLDISVDRKKPSVLIYHTHTTETYQLLDRDFYAEGFLSRSNSDKVNMIRVGKAVSDELKNNGFTVIHDTTVYDNPYSGAYYRSEDAARKYLEKYPSISITLDLHRDAIQDDSGTKTKPVAVIDGKKAAQIMIITGCQEEGNGIDDLPDWEKNLTFALKLQQSMETMYPGLTRPVYFCARSYNMGLTPCSLLIEMGSDANTLSEAVYSGKMLGRALVKILEEYEV